MFSQQKVSVLSLQPYECCVSYRILYYSRTHYTRQQLKNAKHDKHIKQQTDTETSVITIPKQPVITPSTTHRVESRIPVSRNENEQSSTTQKLRNTHPMTSPSSSSVKPRNKYVNIVRTHMQSGDDPVERRRRLLVVPFGLPLAEPVAHGDGVGTALGCVLDADVG